MISRLLPRTRNDCHHPTARRSEYVVLLRMRPRASSSDTRPSSSPIVLVVIAVARGDMKLPCACARGLVVYIRRLHRRCRCVLDDIRIKDSSCTCAQTNA